MNDLKHDISVLNGLIETTIDSADGYREAGQDAKSPQMADLFRRWSSERQEVVVALRQTVRQLGGEPEDDGTVLAAAHRVFVDLRSSMSKTDKAVIEEVERGEDHIKHEFENALSDEKLSPEVRLVIQKAFVSAKAGHDEVSAIKHSLR